MGRYWLIFTAYKPLNTFQRISKANNSLLSKWIPVQDKNRILLKNDSDTQLQILHAENGLRLFESLLQKVPTNGYLSFRGHLVLPTNELRAKIQAALDFETDSSSRITRRSYRPVVCDKLSYKVVHDFTDDRLYKYLMIESLDSQSVILHACNGLLELIYMIKEYKELAEGFQFR